MGNVPPGRTTAWLTTKLRLNRKKTSEEDEENENVPDSRPQGYPWCATMRQRRGELIFLSWHMQPGTVHS